MRNKSFRNVSAVAILMDLFLCVFVVRMMSSFGREITFGDYHGYWLVGGVEAKGKE